MATTALTIDITDAYTLSNSNTSIYLNVSSISSSLSSLISSVSSLPIGLSLYKYDNQSDPVIIVPNNENNININVNNINNFHNNSTNNINISNGPDGVLSLLPITLASSSSSSISSASTSPPVNFTLTPQVELLEQQLNMGFVLNVTRDWPIEYAMIMFGYIMPFLLIITLITNSLVVIVLAQREMRTPTNLVLLAMAISDMLTLLFPSPWYFYNYTLGYHTKILHPPVACYAYHCMIEVIPTFFHTASIWLTLVLAGQRYIYVCHPTVAPKYCTPPKVTRAIVIVFFSSFLLQGTRFVDRDFQSITFKLNTGAHVHACKYYTAAWVRRLLSEDFYYIFYYGFRIIFVNIGPCTALVILNLALFRALRRAQYKRKKLFQENRRSECKKLCDTNCTTLMLIVVVSVFLATELPMALTTVLHVLQNALSIEIATYEQLNLTILFTNFLIMLSYPFNFAIYCGMSRQFRETFKALFISGSRSASDRSRQTREGSTRYSVANGPRTSTNETVL